MSAGFTDADLPMVGQFKSWGADVIELAIVDPAAVDGQRLRVALAESGLQRPVVCGAFGGGRDLRGDSWQIAASVEYVTQLIELAQELGAPVVCGPMYSETGRIGQHTEAARREQFDQIAESLRSLCVRAEAAGVLLALEPLNRFETDCMNTIGQAVEMIELVGSPALKIHIDTFHMNIEEDDSYAAIVGAAEHIAHVHASASHRGLLGHDQVDWDGVFRALAEIKYAGDIVIESFTTDNQAIAKATCIWRRLYESPQQLAETGLKFLREKEAVAKLQD